MIEMFNWVIFSLNSLMFLAKIAEEVETNLFLLGATAVEDKL